MQVISLPSAHAARHGHEAEAKAASNAEDDQSFADVLALSKPTAKNGTSPPSEASRISSRWPQDGSGALKETSGPDSSDVAIDDPRGPNPLQSVESVLTVPSVEPGTDAAEPTSLHVTADSHQSSKSHSLAEVLPLTRPTQLTAKTPATPRSSEDSTTTAGPSEKTNVTSLLAAAGSLAPSPTTDHSAMPTTPPSEHAETAPRVTTHVTASPETHVTASPETHVTASPETHVTASPETHGTAAPTTPVSTATQSLAPSLLESAPVTPLTATPTAAHAAMRNHPSATPTVLNSTALTSSSEHTARNDAAEPGSTSPTVSSAPAAASSIASAASGEIPRALHSAGAAQALASSTSASTPNAHDLAGVASQLVSVLSPLRSTDTTNSISIALHPAQLGDVHATLTMSDGQLYVRLAPSTLDGATAIRQALPELHAELTQDGSSLTLTLSDTALSGGGQQSTGNESLANSRFGDGSNAAGTTSTLPQSPSESTSAAATARLDDSAQLLDVRL